MVKRSPATHGGGVQPLGLLRGAEVGELRLLQHGKAGVLVADGVGQRQHQIPLHTPIGHFNEGALLEPDAHQVGLGLQAFQVGANGARLAEHASIVQLQHGNARQRIALPKRGAAVFAGVDVDQHRFNASHAFFGDEHLHPARIGCALRQVELHARGPFRRRAAAPLLDTEASAHSRAKRPW